ncbi:MAG: recombinase family protein [Deltaproteobacteria bacterium]|nr:recombinase family protein [Deltaproteobacteria bacterium]MBW2151787.1 recombinase family protein [Deltaproteobacteria bacterium]
MKPLRFAPLVRVSSEQQERRGESLNVQRKAIENYVEALGGTLIDNPWRYSGQEHATGIEEREKLDSLLADSGKGLFDALIVYDTSRWSRDNLKSKQGLETLRQNGVRFFCGMQELDLWNPDHTLILGIGVEIGEYQAKKQTRRSLESRIEKAKRGELASGNRPVGRTWNKKTKQWGIDPAVKAKYEQIAAEFLAGKSIPQLAKAYGMDRRRLQDNLYSCMGTKWVQKIDGRRYGLGIQEFKTQIPRLLPDETVQAIRCKIDAHKTVYHGKIKNSYLLSRMVICGHCGRALYGVTINGYPYYRHEKGECKYFTYIACKLLEQAIVPHVFRLIGDAPAMERAALSAIPSREAREKIEARLRQNKRDLLKINSAINQIQTAYESEIYTQAEASTRIKNHRVRKETLQAEAAKLQTQLANMPEGDAVIRRARLALKQLQETMSTWRHFTAMNWDDKRAMLQMLFTAPDHEGNRSGVYLWKDNRNSDEPWYYEIRGTIGGNPVFDVERFSTGDYKVDSTRTTMASPLSAPA